MFNYVEKIKPEIKEDQLFQDGLSRIKKVQIILFSIFIVLTIATLLMSSGPKDLNTVANIVMRLAVIVLLSTGAELQAENGIKGKKRIKPSKPAQPK